MGVVEDKTSPADVAVDATEVKPIEVQEGPALAERLQNPKLEKILKKCVKAGGKRGVEIEGAADMGGLQYFCTKMDEPEGHLDLLVECVKAMNAKSDPGEEERKGGSGHIGKMISSCATDESKISFVAYVPKEKSEECSAKTWLENVMLNLGCGTVSGDDTYAMCEVVKDLEKNQVPVKLRDPSITHSLTFLRKKGLFPEDDSDDEDEMVFGDEDFPQAGDEEEVVASTEPPLAERLQNPKLEKILKKCVKAGGKRGVEIEGAADMGGLQYFCTKMDEPEGHLDLLVECVKAMNAKSDPGEEERKGGSGHIGKMISSCAADESKISFVAYVPLEKKEECSAKTWLESVMLNLGCGEVTGDETYAMCEVVKNLDKDIVPVKLRDPSITHSLTFLRKKGLFPEDDSDDDDEMVFGDEDFPQAGDEEETPAGPAEPPLAERLQNPKLEKILKKCTKAGGKRGVEIEGAADMGGLQYFCTKMDEPEGHLDLLVECVKAMNAKSDPGEEERKGGSGHIGKMIVSCANDESKISFVAYVPQEKASECSAKAWLENVMLNLGCGEVTGDDMYAMCEVVKDLEKNAVPVKLRDPSITHSLTFLRKKGLFPEDDSDDEDEMVFGDEDFPEM